MTSQLIPSTSSSSPTQPLNLLNLPIEILHKIFKYMPFGTIANKRNVSD